MTSDEVIAAIHTPTIATTPSTQETPMSDLGWSSYIAAWEAAEMGKCFEAAEKHGMTPLQAEDCDDGDKGCPECPWKDLPNYAVKKDEEK